MRVEEVILVSTISPVPGELTIRTLVDGPDANPFFLVIVDNGETGLDYPRYQIIITDVNNHWRSYSLKAGEVRNRALLTALYKGFSAVMIETTYPITDHHKKIINSRIKHWVAGNNL